MPLGLHRLFRRRQAAWWTLVVGLAVTAALGWELHREAVKLDRQRLAIRVAEIQSQLDARLEKSEMLLNNLKDFLMLSGESRNAVFDRWCFDTGLTINCRWIHGILVATNRHTPQWRNQFPNPPGDWNNDDWERLRGIMRRQPIDCEIALQSSITNSKRFQPDYFLRSFGHQGFLRSSQRDLFAHCVMNSRLAMSEKQSVMLDANSNSFSGTLFYVPVYRPELSDLIADLAAAGRTKWSERATVNWLHLTSVIVAPVDFAALVEAVRDGAPPDLGVELFSSINQTRETVLYASEGSPRAADPQFKAYLTHRQLWPMYGMKFSIFFYTTPLFEAQSPRRLAKVAVAAGTSLTLLATALVGVALRARNRQELLTEQIREARDALAAAQQERNKISRDLHDGTIQSLYAIQLGLGYTLKRLEAEPARAGNELSAVRRELDSVIAEIRQFITAETSADKAVDFGAVLHALVQRAQAGTPARIDLRCEPAASARLSGDQAVQLANIAREALSNSLRHANPRQVRIALRSEQTSVEAPSRPSSSRGNEAHFSSESEPPHVGCYDLDRASVVLEISDDGAGFDLKSPRRTGVGLASMASRAREVGGAFDVQSSPGKGTRVIVRVPARSREPVEAESPAFDSTTNGHE